MVINQIQLSVQILQKVNQTKQVTNKRQVVSMNKRRNLPPDVQQQVTFGIMWIRIGRLKIIGKTRPSSSNILVQFWGQKQPSILQTTSNPLNKNQQTTMIQYDVKCPVTFFKDYLLDMKKNLRIQVENVGKINFDITKFLKQQVQLTSRHAFQHFKGAFQILGKHNKKIGSVEIQMACNFNPEIAQLELANDQQTNSNHPQKSIIDRINSPGIDKDLAIDILAIQNPKLLNQFYEQTIKSKKKINKPVQQIRNLYSQQDNRIANSLNTQLSTQKFDAQKYLQSPIKNSPIKISASNKMKGVGVFVEQDRIFEQQIKQQIVTFPTIAKVLTYSNLRLVQQTQKQQKQQKQQQNQKSNKVINQSSKSINKQPSQNVIKQISSKKQLQSRDESLYEQFYGKQQYATKKKVQSQNQIQTKNVIQTKGPVQYAISNRKGSDDISEIPIRKITQQIQQNLLQSQKQVLSRVVNLDQQLKKSHIQSPVKQKGNQKSQITYHQKQVKQMQPLTYQYKTSYPLVKAQPYQSTHKPSSLVLNLIVQIQRDSIEVQGKFVIVHRPYGCKERIKLGPKFQNHTITIISPITETLLNKMDKLPFIIEFWTLNNAFIGIIRIQLIKIKKGFMINGRLNQIALKTSLMPIIITKGQISIQNLDNQKVGGCNIYAGLGTTAQLESYFNSNKKSTIQNIQIGNDPKKQKPSRQSSQSIKRQIVISQKGQLNFENIHIVLTELMDHINKNSSKNISILANIMKKKQLSIEQFTQFLSDINWVNKSTAQLVQIFKSPQNFGLQHISRPFIQTLLIKHNFDQFKQQEQLVLKQFYEINTFIRNKINQQTKSKILKTSNFNIVQKSILRQIVINQIQDHRVVQYYLGFFQDYLNVNCLFNNQTNTYYQPTINRIIDSVYQHFYYKLLQNNKSLHQLQRYINTQPANILFETKIYNFCKQKMNFQLGTFSVWYWIVLINISKSKHKFIQELNNRSNLYQSIIVVKQRIKSQKNINKINQAFKPIAKTNNVKKIQKVLQNQSINESNIHDILKKIQQVQIIPQSVLIPQSLVRPQNILNSMSINKQNNVSKDILIQKQEQQKQSLSQDKKLIYYQHSFILKGVQLFIQHPFQGQCQISYKFPFDEQAIISKKIKLFNNKHRYVVSIYGSHKIVIDNKDINNYLNDQPINIVVTNTIDDMGILMEGDLHTDQILQQDQHHQHLQKRQHHQQYQHQSNDIKVVPLFTNDIQKVQGKLKIQVQYKCQQTQNQAIGKQTVYNLYLPKSGFVNFNFIAKLEAQKIKQQFRLQEDEFYVVLMLDIFKQNKNLKSHYPLISSSLFSNIGQQICFQSSLKLSLNPIILQYIKQKHCLLSLNIIYYSKQKGNYQKKEINYATLRIPLINLISEHGLNGNYAFKNNYGMFVGLCNANITYDKHQKKQQTTSQTQLGITNMSISKSRNVKYWIIVHFKQLINFEQDIQTSSVRFQTIFKGTKHTTQKINLSQDPLLLFNDYIMLSLSEQQFFSLKILPISIQFDKKQKLAIDINLKPIAKKLTQHKYNANGGYFLVVDQNSQLTKIRVGARLLTFKGNSLIEPFINALCNNLDFDVFNEIDMPRDLQDHNKMLELFRNHLKLSKKSFDQSLRQLLSTKSEKLSLQLLSSQLLFKLDLTPIIAQSEQQVDSLIHRISGIMSERALIQYIKQNNYKLTNFESSVIHKYCFDQLWHSQKLDKNTQFFNLNSQIDVLTLVRKIKVIQNNNQASAIQQGMNEHQQLRIILQKGLNFHYLYNGIKPNVILRIPQLNYQSKVKSRSSQPYFNQSLREIVQQQNIHIYRKLRFQIYHLANTVQGLDQELLIGQGTINICSILDFDKHINQTQEKHAKVIISSTMSSKMKATLEISLKLSNLGQTEYDNDRKNVHNETQNQIQDASRIQDMIKGINKDMQDKRYMFQGSSDDQY